jgi:TPR repeat protein
MKHLRCLLIIFSLIFGSALAGMAQDLSKGSHAWMKEKWAAALREFVPLAQQGDAVAQFFVGTAYMNGSGLKQDYVLARKWMRMSADQGNASAQYVMGVFYSDGIGVPQDFATAVRWFRRSVERGFVVGYPGTAHYMLGHAYAAGDGPGQDPHRLRIGCFARIKCSW